MQTASPDSRARTSALSTLLIRSLLPLAAIALLVSTLVLGPWGFLIATFAWWQIVRRIG